MPHSYVGTSVRRSAPLDLHHLLDRAGRRRARGLPATKPPKLSPERQEQLRRLAATGEPVTELAKVFGIGRATAYRYLQDRSA